MASSLGRSFVVRLLLWAGAFGIAAFAFIVTLRMPDLGAARIVTGVGVAATLWGLIGHVRRTNMEVARFLDALRFGDTSARFEASGGAGFDEMGATFNDALARLRSEREAAAAELAFREALVDDMAVALLTIDTDGRVLPVNKAARRLFRGAAGARAADYERYGATFAKRLADQDATGGEVLLLTLDDRPQRALVRFTALDRLGRRVRAVTVQPIQGTLNAIEMAAQADIVRVLTHEILNSLTPVTSLASTAAALLESGGDADDARIAVTTLARRAEGLTHFVESYRTIARAPVVEPARFEAAAFADELARLFAADWPGIALVVSVTPQRLTLDADRALLGQVLINLLRNAATAASEHGPAPTVALSIAPTGLGQVAIDVTDNGPGVPAALRGDVFLPFFTTRKAGTGVGLNLARQVVTAHGGTIDVDDAPEGGARFRILL